MALPFAVPHHTSIGSGVMTYSREIGFLIALRTRPLEADVQV